ncbi:hypothetical protein [Salinibacterium sp. TMP30]|uniref:hypothetical protein n=1 Tax=Salinibacterium sp. TMP30 TaxID=3138237 RepID=UPI0031388F40
MTLTRMWTLIGAIAVLLILFAGYAAGVAPALAAASSADEEIETVELQNRVKANELAELKKLDENSEKLFADVAELEKSIPSTHETSVFSQQLAVLAAAAGVKLTDVTFISAMDAVAPEEAAAPVAPAEGDEQAPAEAEAQTPAPAEPSAQSVPSVPGLVAMGVDVSVVGSYAAVNAFMQSVQMNARSFSVATVSVQQGTTDAEYEMSLSGAVYVLADGATTTATTGGGNEVN